MSASGDAKHLVELSGDDLSTLCIVLRDGAHVADLNGLHVLSRRCRELWVKIGQQTVDETVAAIRRDTGECIFRRVDD